MEKLASSKYSLMGYSQNTKMVEGIIPYSPVSSIMRESNRPLSGQETPQTHIHTHTHRGGVFRKEIRNPQTPA